MLNFGSFFFSFFNFIISLLLFFSFNFFLFIIYLFSPFSFIISFISYYFLISFNSFFIFIFIFSPESNLLIFFVFFIFFKFMIIFTDICFDPSIRHSFVLHDTIIVLYTKMISLKSTLILQLYTFGIFWLEYIRRNSSTLFLAYVVSQYTLEVRITKI